MLSAVPNTCRTVCISEYQSNGCVYMLYTATKHIHYLYNAMCHCMPLWLCLQIGLCVPGTAHTLVTSC